MYQTTGPSYAASFDPSRVLVTRVGSASIDFLPSGLAPGVALLTWNVGNATQTKQIQRQSFGNAPPAWANDATDIWWNPAESGWGLTLAQHGNNVFGVWFTYNAAGQPLFVVLPGVTYSAPDTFSGTLYTTTGPSYTNATFDPSLVRNTPVGNATIRFSGSTGTFTATVNGFTQTKTITRQPFGLASLSPVGTGMSNRVEESDAAVTLSGAWTRSDSSWGWSGGSAMQSTAAGATASLTFTGTSVRWIGSRGRGMGIASVSVDGGPAREMDLFAHPTDEIHTPIITIYDLSAGQHTLTIRVTGRQNVQAQGNVVVVDAFDVQPGTTVSHWQDTNPEARFSAGWTKSSNNFPWSGSGVSNLPEVPVTAQETQTAGETLTLPFRGTAISWIGYRGPDAGIAVAQVDGGAPTEVDMYSPTAKYQPVVFTAAGLADVTHILTIQATGRKNAASTAARVVVDAFDVITPGRRYEEYDPSISYVGVWTHDNEARVWSEGVTATSNQTGATATFSFVGTSVSWIGCEKGSAGGVANISLDGAFVKEVKLNQSYPIEGYQMTVFRMDGLSNGPHTLTIQVTNTDGSYVVVDAFDVHP